MQAFVKEENEDGGKAAGDGNRQDRDVKAIPTKETRSDAASCVVCIWIPCTIFKTFFTAEI